MRQYDRVAESGLFCNKLITNNIQYSNSRYMDGYMYILYSYYDGHICLCEHKTMRASLIVFVCIIVYHLIHFIDSVMQVFTTVHCLYGYTTHKLHIYVIISTELGENINSVRYDYSLIIDFKSVNLFQVLNESTNIQILLVSVVFIIFLNLLSPFGAVKKQLQLSPLSVVF